MLSSSSGAAPQNLPEVSDEEIADAPSRVSTPRDDGEDAAGEEEEADPEPEAEPEEATTPAQESEQPSRPDTPLRTGGRTSAIPRKRRIGGGLKINGEKFLLPDPASLDFVKLDADRIVPVGVLGL